MRIGIDARLYHESGVGRYIRNLLNQLVELDDKNEYVVFLLNKDIDQVILPKNFQKVVADFRWYSLKEQWQMPKLLNKYQLDLVHFPHFNVPIMYRGKYVVTIHDLIHQKVQMRRATTRDPLTYKIKQLGYGLVFETALKKSEKIITVSDFVAEELKQMWSVDGQKIVITKEAVEPAFIELIKSTNQKLIQQVQDKFKIDGPYLYYVGNAHPHKNVEGLIKAFDQLSKKNPKLKLVLSGHDHYFWQRVKNEFSRENIVFTGYVTDQELAGLMKGSQLFVLPSLEEGFGIPLLEAMAAGVPVVSSEAASLPEVGGDACLYFDPRDLNQMTEQIQRVLDDEKLKKQLIDKGQKRYQQFSWRRLAEQTLKVYQSNK